jgi:poly-gamma-glutamate synthesis protein (capsule biosynthesis protein)
VLISPDHFDRADETVTTASRPFVTFEGRAIEVDAALVSGLTASGLVAVDDDAARRDHGVGMHLAHLDHFAPGARLVPLLVKAEAAANHVDAVARWLVNHVDVERTVFILSMDASHGLPRALADRHDQHTLAALQTFDLEGLGRVETDTQQGLRLFLRVMQALGATTVTPLAMANSDDVFSSPQPSTTGHMVVAFSPPTAASSTPPARQVSLQFFGDVFLGRALAEQVRFTPVTNRSCPGWNKHARSVAVFSDIEDVEQRFFAGVDGTVVNLEGTLSSSSPRDRYRLSQPPGTVEALAAIGVVAANVANNHMGDHGEAGFRATTTALGQHGILAVGAPGASSQSCAMFRRHGLQIAMCGFNDVVSPLDLDAAAAAVAAARADADFVVVQMHAGREHVVVADARQRALAHRFVEAGADVVIGHHPHVVQPMELHRGRPIFYSLGNFVFSPLDPSLPWSGAGVHLTFREEAGQRSLHWLELPLQHRRGKPSLDRQAMRAGPVAGSTALPPG